MTPLDRYRRVTSWMIGIVIVCVLVHLLTHVLLAALHIPTGEFQ